MGFVLFSMILAGMGPSSASADFSSPFLPTQCPRTPAELADWRPKLIPLLTFDSFTPNDVLDKIRSCSREYPYVFRSPAAEACLFNIQKFARAMGATADPNRLYGFRMSDRCYRAGYYRDRPDVTADQIAAAPASMTPAELGGPDGICDPMYRMPRIAAGTDLTAQDPPPDLTSALTLPSGEARLIDLISDPARYAEAEQAVALINARRAEARPPQPAWRIARYTSRHLKTPEPGGLETYGRTLLYAPNETGEIDQWIQVGSPVAGDPTPPPRGRNLSIVSVDKDPAPPRVNMVDRWRDYDSEGRVVLPLGYRQFEGQENCYKCHKTGVIPIQPVPGSTTTGDAAIIDQMNATIENYDNTLGPPNFKLLVDAEGYGPPMGVSSTDPAVPSDRLLRVCTRGITGVSESDFPTIRQNMNCASCHSGGGPPMQGVLNYPMGSTATLSAPGTPGDLIESFVVNAAVMPPHSSLTAPLRRAIANCVREQYYGGLPASPAWANTEPGLLKSWFLESSCPADYGEIRCTPVSTWVIPDEAERRLRDLYDSLPLDQRRYTSGDTHECPRYWVRDRADAVPAGLPLEGEFVPPPPGARRGR